MHLTNGMGRIRHWWLRAGILAACVVLSGKCYGQSDSSGTARKTLIRSYSAGLQHGFIFAHSEAVQNTKGSNPTGLELAIGWQRNDSSSWALCNCFPKKGLLLAWYDYDNGILGKNLTAAWFLEPSYRINSRMFFSFRAAGGLSYLNNPFDSVHNPTNMSYSTRLSGYLSLGLGVYLKVGEGWWINPTINYQHVSNGGAKQPNKGINWPTAGLNITYQRDKKGYYQGPRVNSKSWKQRALRYEAALFGNARRSVGETGSSKRMVLLGLGLGLAKAVGRINDVTATMEVYHDASTARRLQSDSLEASSVKVGASIGHQFLLGRFIFSQRLGIYLFDQTPYNDILFHRWGLQFMISEQWGAGFSLQAHRHIAEFIDLRVVYTWQRRK